MFIVEYLLKSYDWKEKLKFAKLRFSSLKKLSPCQSWGAPTHEDITELYKFLLQLKNQRSGSKTLSCFSIILIL